MISNEYGTDSTDFLLSPEGEEPSAAWQLFQLPSCAVGQHGKLWRRLGCQALKGKPCRPHDTTSARCICLHVLIYDPFTPSSLLSFGVEMHGAGWDPGRTLTPLCFLSPLVLSGFILREEIEGKGHMLMSCNCCPLLHGGQAALWRGQDVPALSPLTSFSLCQLERRSR